MKLLLVADLHYTLKQWDWLGIAADRFDLVVVAGDLLDIASIVPLEAQIVVVRKYLHRLAATAPTLVSSGNHDILESRQSAERTADWLREDRQPRLHVDGDSFTQDGFFFSILPWWDGPESRQQVEEQLKAQAPGAAGKRWVWIYHPPPQNSPVAWNGRRDLGDSTLSRWIADYHPEMVLGGHIHNAPFYKDGSWIDCVDGTWVFNGGRQPGSVPTFTIVDTGENRALWIAADDAEQATLSAPLVRSPLDA